MSALKSINKRLANINHYEANGDSRDDEYLRIERKGLQDRLYLAREVDKAIEASLIKLNARLLGM